jgi:hypothetical protein
VGVGKSSEKSVMGDWIDSCLPNVGMLKIQQTTDRGAVVLTVSGRLDAENVGQLCELLDAVSIDATVEPSGQALKIVFG